MVRPMATPRQRQDLQTKLDPLTFAARAPLWLDRVRQPILLPLAAGRSLQVDTTADQAHLCIRADGQRDLSITIRFEQTGPVVSVQARELQLTGFDNITAECATFAVHARERIELHSGGDLLQQAQDTARIVGRQVEVEATPGAIRMKANDEVQLLGEMILLNCDHPSTLPPTPSWASCEQTPLALPAEASSGDVGVVAEMLVAEMLGR